MHLLGALLAVIGAWMILSVPVALLAGRFLRVASAASVRARVEPGDESFRNTAA